MNLVEHAAHELETNGFVVLKGLVTAGDIPREVVDFVRGAKTNIDGTVWPLPRFPQAAKLEQTLDRTISDVAARLGISATSGGATSAIRVTEGKGGLDWHLDHFNYYYTHNAVDHLTCYLPIFKPVVSASNVAILPYTVLRRVDPVTYDRLKGRGAVDLAKLTDDSALARARKRVTNPRSLAIGDWVAFDNYRLGRRSFRLNLDPEEHRVVPQLEIGDFLMFRADVLHRTEDTRTERIALRLDAYPTRSIGRLSRLYKSVSTRASWAILRHNLARLRRG
jgi:hypothetical protein